MVAINNAQDRRNLELPAIEDHEEKYEDQVGEEWGAEDNPDGEEEDNAQDQRHVELPANNMMKIILKIMRKNVKIQFQRSGVQRTMPMESRRMGLKRRRRSVRKIKVRKTKSKGESKNKFKGKSKGKGKRTPRTKDKATAKHSKIKMRPNANARPLLRRSLENKKKTKQDQVSRMG